MSCTRSELGESRPVFGSVDGWMNTNSWLVNIIVCVVFIALILL